MKLTLESRNGQNFGFPLRPYFSRYAPFFSDAMACNIKLQIKLTKRATGVFIQEHNPMTIKTKMYEGRQYCMIEKPI